MKATTSSAALAAAFMEDPGGTHWGYALSKRSGLKSGVLYPLLARMLTEGWLRDGWEDPASYAEKRPPRRYYRLTDLGARELGALAARSVASTSGIVVRPRMG